MHNSNPGAPGVSEKKWRAGAGENQPAKPILRPSKRTDVTTRLMGYYKSGVEESRENAAADLLTLLKLQFEEGREMEDGEVWVNIWGRR